MHGLSNLLISKNEKKIAPALPCLFFPGMVSLIQQ